MNIWLTLHVIGVVLFVGNIVTAAFWKVRADMTKNATEMHNASKNVMLADYIFTLPGLALIVISGIVMAARAGIAMSGLNWLTASLVIFAVSGIVWGAILIPLQHKMIRYSREGIETGVIPTAYTGASRAWNVFGTAATLLPIVILYLMIAKGF